MTLNAINEFMIHFHIFRNVDLINQGLYQIRFRLYYIDKGVKHYGVPYFFTDARDSDSNILTEENAIRPHNIITSYIHENGRDYISKTFLIRYSDEEVDIDEFCHFRLETGLKNELTFYFEYELYFSDALLVVNKERKSNMNNIEFKSVCTQVVLMSYETMRNGFISSYVPINFIDSFYSLLGMSIHIINSDYRIKYKGIPMFCITDNDKNQSVAITKPDNTSLIEYFINEKEIKYTLELEIIDRLYDTYVASLIGNYFCLRNKYMKLVNKLIDDKLRSEYSFFVLIQPFTLYNDKKDKESFRVNEFNYVNIPKFTGRILDHTSEYVSSRLLLEINIVSSQINQLWHKYVEIMRYFPYQSNFILHNEYINKYKDRYM
jgi:hypothetical protein